MTRGLTSRDAGGFDAARRELDRLTALFPGRVHVELQRHFLREEEHLNRAFLDLANAARLPVLATNGARYAGRKDKDLFDALTCIRHHTHLDAAGKLLSPNAERYLKSAEQMRELFRDCPEAIRNSARLAGRLEFTLENLGYEFPSFPVPPEHTMDSWLRDRAFAGARWRYGEVPAKRGLTRGSFGIFHYGKQKVIHPAEFPEVVAETDRNARPQYGRNQAGLLRHKNKSRPQIILSEFGNFFFRQLTSHRPQPASF